MNRRITIVAATEKEIGPFLVYLQKNAEQHSFQTYQLHQLFIDILYTGIGVMQSMYALMDYLNHRHPDGWIQAGIGGDFEGKLIMGEVYQVTSEMLVGFGAEDQDGSILDSFELGWLDRDVAPYEAGLLHCPHVIKYEIPKASGMTSFHSHGSEQSISQMKKKSFGQIESMEGAPFFFVSLMKKIPFLCFRSISNRVEPRNKDNWQINEAVENLNAALILWLEEGEYNVDKLFGIGNQ